jgi:hypothetical protein
VSLIGAAVIQTDLREARQLDLAGPAPVIDERHRAQLGIRIGRHTNAPARLEVADAATELGHVVMKLVLIFPPARLSGWSPTDQIRTSVRSRA